MSKARSEIPWQVPRVSLSIEEACASLGISWDMWDEYVAPEVKIVRLGRRKLVPVAELEGWLARMAEKPVTLDELRAEAKASR